MLACCLPEFQALAVFQAFAPLPIPFHASPDVSFAKLLALEACMPIVYAPVVIPLPILYAAPAVAMPAVTVFATVLYACSIPPAEPCAELIRLAIVSGSVNVMAKKTIEEANKIILSLK